MSKSMHCVLLVISVLRASIIIIQTSYHQNYGHFYEAGPLTCNGNTKKENSVRHSPIYKSDSTLQICLNLVLSFQFNVNFHDNFYNN